MIVQTVLSIKQALKYCSEVGYVYPTSDKAYYINSNVQPKDIIECSDGYFFGDANANLKMIRSYEFKSETVSFYRTIKTCLCWLDNEFELESDNPIVSFCKKLNKEESNRFKKLNLY